MAGLVWQVNNTEYSISSFSLIPSKLMQEILTPKSEISLVSKSVAELTAPSITDNPEFTLINIERNEAQKTIALISAGWFI
jgi:hypothetical protein